MGESVNLRLPITHLVQWYITWGRYSLPKMTPSLSLGPATDSTVRTDAVFYQL